jgi:hypothetical protein
MPVWKEEFLGPSSGESSQDCLLWNGRRSFIRQGVLRTDGSYTHPAPFFSRSLSPAFSKGWVLTSTGLWSRTTAGLHVVSLALSRAPHNAHVSCRNWGSSSRLPLQHSQPTKLRGKYTTLLSRAPPNTISVPPFVFVVREEGGITVRISLRNYWHD